ncbi:hypothetical protein Drorol1_Dr00019603 [Drosera rotundifolia]
MLYYRCWYDGNRKRSSSSPATGCNLLFKAHGQGLCAVAEGCSDLRSISVSSCEFVTDKLLGSLSNNCHNLETLRLNDCSKIADSGLSTLVIGCRRIKNLAKNRCINAADPGICSISV